MDASRRSFCAAGALALAGCAATGPSADAARAQLAPTGKLRAAINYGNPVLASRGPDGQPRGVSVDLAREAARRLGLPLELVPVAAAGDAVAALKGQRADLGFVAIDPVRGADMDYTPPYVIIEGAYIVRADSPLRANEEVDRAGNRIVVGRNSAYDLYLTRELKAATLVRITGSENVVREFAAQRLEVGAGVRQQLEADAKATPGVRILPGRFMVIEQAVASPKARPGVAAALRDFIEAQKASGFVARALAASGQADAVVAPPAP
ncbi:MAG: transporter substrate-binding domain-containing protein [Comamonadaceae bacterium]|nr:MAG: transporter substrate-binding domain-containing protein [Comamonadaceae bacterium]